MPPIQTTQHVTGSALTATTPVPSTIPVPKAPAVNAVAKDAVIATREDLSDDCLSF